jgi:hypothetical protein
MTAIHTNDYRQLRDKDMAIYQIGKDSNTMLTQDIVEQTGRRSHVRLKVNGHDIEEFANSDELELLGFVRLEYHDDIPHLNVKKTNIAYLMETLRFALGDWYHSELLRQSIWMDLDGSFARSRKINKRLAESCMATLRDVYDAKFSSSWFDAMENYAKEQVF